MLFKNILSKQTARAIQFDLLRLRARWKSTFSTKKDHPRKLHFGCGQRLMKGWLNVDLIHSDYDIDLSCGHLPFDSDYFEVAVSQHVVEHLEIQSELLPLLKELNRTLKSGGELWLSCPDMQKICEQYSLDRGADLLADRHSRFPDFTLEGLPVQHMINDLFHQNGEHKNLFDFDLMKDVLTKAGFNSSSRSCESDFLQRFPEFPSRNDDFVSLYMVAVKQ